MIDEKRIADFFAELVFIDSPSLEECEMADTLKAKFAEIGVNFTEDHTQEQTGSNAGNLFARIPGSIDGAPVLFAAHMDTVEPAKGKKAVTAIYEAVRHITEAGAPHSPIEILISTGEELYCKGANAFDYSQVQAKEAYVLDLSGAIGAAAYAAPTLVSFKAEIQGKAAHAGFHPEDGINSIQAAARAVAQLPQGHVAESTTANIGKIGGGSGTNIVSESCLVEGEIRSLNHETAMELLATYQKTFQQEADAIGAKLVWEEKLNIHAYETPLTGVAAKHYESAVAKEGLTAAFEKTFGGSDNNVFAQHGIEGLVIATSMNQVHSCGEYTKIPEIAQVARIVANLAALQED